MKEEKKEITKAEVEVIRFEKNDVIATSECGFVGGGEAMGED